MAYVFALWVVLVVALWLAYRALRDGRLFWIPGVAAVAIAVLVVEYSDAYPISLLSERAREGDLGNALLAVALVAVLVVWGVVLLCVGSLRSPSRRGVRDKAPRRRDAGGT